MGGTDRAAVALHRCVRLARNLRWHELWAVAQADQDGRGDLVDVLARLGTFAQDMHAAMLSFVEPIPPSTSELRAPLPPAVACPGESLCSAAVLAQFEAERRRLKVLAGFHGDTPWGHAVVHAARAYYGLIMFDGFRTAFWLQRSLDDLDVLQPLPAPLRRLHDQLRDTVERVVTPAAASGPYRPPELYSALQVVVDHLAASSTPNRAGLELVDDFGIRLDLDVDHVCPASGEPRG